MTSGNIERKSFPKVPPNSSVAVKLDKDLYNLLNKYSY
jgi:hypothetical protein